MKIKPSNLLILFLLSISCRLGAVDLMDVYRQALTNDPTFQQAYSTYMSSAEAIPQAQAALLPSLILKAQGGRNLTDIQADNFDINNTYNSHQWQAQASQAVFNYSAWSNVQQARASVKAAQATFNNAAQELILRTARAYLDALYAQDTLKFSEAKKRANKRQFEQADQRYKVGLDAITAVYESKAAYDQSTAEVISANNNLINQSENLRKLTNHVYEHLAPLRDSNIPLIRPEPENVDEWISIGIKQNYKLHAANYGLEAARENIKVKTGGNWPVFSLQGNAQQVNNSGSTVPNTPGSGDLLSQFFVPTRMTNANVALAMNFPIFQGGLVVSQTRQAQYDFQTSSGQLEQVYRDLVVNSRITFNSIIDGISKVKADRQTVMSRVRSLDSTTTQFDVGTRTMVDVVNAQERLFESQEELAKDQYDLINALLNLKYLAGSLNADDLAQINSWLATTRINGFPPLS